MQLMMVVRLAACSKPPKFGESPYFHEEVRNMTNQNVPEKDAKAQNKPVDEAAPKAAKPAAVRELTDDEIAAVAGGLAVGHGGKMNPP
jgi:hypothetical protein